MQHISLPLRPLAALFVAIGPLLFSACGPENTLQQPAPPATTTSTSGLDAPLCRGDLIFIGSPSAPSTEGMEHAIASATGSYTHVAIAISADSVIDATPHDGVSRRSMAQLCSELDGATPVVCRIVAAEWDSAALLPRLLPLLGKGYDLYFRPDNDLYYCSELVQEAYRDKQNRPLFPSAPMNFLATDGTLPAYWQHLFDSLGCPVPQGMPGTNPSDMASSPLLQRK